MLLLCYMCCCSLCFIPFEAGTQSGGTRAGNRIPTMSVWRKPSCDSSSLLIILPHLFFSSVMVWHPPAPSPGLSCAPLHLAKGCFYSKVMALSMAALVATAKWSWPPKLKMFLQPIKTFSCSVELCADTAVLSLGVTGVLLSINIPQNVLQNPWGCVEEQIRTSCNIWLLLNEVHGFPFHKTWTNSIIFQSREHFPNLKL